MKTCKLCQHKNNCQYLEDVVACLPYWMLGADSRNAMAGMLENLASRCPVSGNGPCARCGRHKENWEAKYCDSCDSARHEIWGGG